MGDLTCRCRFPAQVSGLRTPDDGNAEAGGEKYERASQAGVIFLKKGLKSGENHGIVYFRDNYFSLFTGISCEPETKRR